MENDSIKMVLVGNSGVGKTSIMGRYIDNIFDVNTRPTICANSVEKTIIKGKKKYALNIWDTVGKEKYQALSKHFYKDAYIILLIYDITNQNSLDSLKNTCYPDIKKYGESYVLLGIVGNKSDLFEKKIVLMKMKLMILLKK